MRTYLVTGGAGFIGSNFIHYMLKKYKDIFIINLDKLTYAGNLTNLKSIEKDDRYTFVKGDIRDIVLVESLFDQYEIDYTVNFAAESHVDRSIQNPIEFVKTNIEGTFVLLEVAKKAWRQEKGWKEGKKFLQISTDEVYGSLGETGFFTEESPIQPRNPYAASKASADLLVQSYFNTYHMPVNITRCANNYGPYQFPEKLIPLMINNCLHGKDLPIYGDGKNIRDWIYVEDHSRAIDHVIHRGRLGQVYNIGGKNEKTNIEMVKTIICTLKKMLPETEIQKWGIGEERIRYVSDRKGHDRRYAIDARKIWNELNWKAQVSFQEGMIKTVQWYLDHQEWLEDINTGEYKRYYEKKYIQG